MTQSERIEKLIFDLESDVTDIRLEAVKMLARISDIQAISALKKAMSDRSPLIRYIAKRAVHKFEQLQQKIKLEDLNIDCETITISEYRSLLYHPEIPIRLMACAISSKLISRFKQEEIVSLLKERYGEENDVYVLSAIVSSISLIARAPDIPFLLDASRSRESRIRANAIEGFEGVSDQRVLVRVVKALTDDDARVRANAVKVLRSFKEIDLYRVVKAMLEDESLPKRASALYAVRFLNYDFACELLEEFIKKEKDNELFEKAVKLLSEISNEPIQNIDIFEDLDEKKREIVRNTALTLGLCKLEDNEFKRIRILMDNLSHKDPYIRNKASVDLLLEASHKTIHIIEEGLRSSSPFVRYICKKALKKVKTGEIDSNTSKKIIATQKKQPFITRPIKFTIILLVIVIIFSGFIYFVISRKVFEKKEKSILSRKVHKLRSQASAKTIKELKSLFKQLNQLDNKKEKLRLSKCFINKSRILNLMKISDINEKFSEIFRLSLSDEINQDYLKKYIESENLVVHFLLGLKFIEKGELNRALKRMEKVKALDEEAFLPRLFLVMLLREKNLPADFHIQRIKQGNLKYHYMDLVDLGRLKIFIPESGYFNDEEVVMLLELLVKKKKYPPFRFPVGFLKKSQQN